MIHANLTKSHCLLRNLGLNLYHQDISIGWPLIRREGSCEYQAKFKDKSPTLLLEKEIAQVHVILSLSNHDHVGTERKHIPEVKVLALLFGDSSLKRRVHSLLLF